MDCKNNKEGGTIEMFRYLACLIAAATLLVAQLALSTIRGAVKDPSGSAVVGAEIRITNLRTNIQRTTATNESGDFEIPDLGSGVYRLTATSPGFGTFVADNIILESSQIRRIDVNFEVAAVASEVTVQADAAVITTDTAKLQSAFTAKRFEEAPWIGDGRNGHMVFITLPTVQSTSGIYGIQLAGLPGGQIQMAVDGVATDGAGYQGSYVHHMQEVSVVTANNTAEYPRAGFISLLTKGGTNSFHGQASYWHQSSSLAARDFFAARKPQTLFHTMQAQLSGPVRRDKTFFLFSWMGQRWPGSSFYLRDVPTNRMRQGDFSELLAAARPVTLRDPTTGNPFPGNVIPASRQNPTALRVVDKYLPAPNLGAAGALANNFGFEFPRPTDLFRVDSYNSRIDHQISPNNTIFGRVLYDTPLYVLAGNFPGLGWTRVRKNLNIMIQDTHIFSPAVVNTLRFGFYRPNVDDGTEVDGVLPLRGDAVVGELGIQGVNPKGLSAMGFPRMDITGYLPLRVQPGGVLQRYHNWDYADTLTWAKGRHVLKMGGEYRRITSFSNTVPEGSYGAFNFNGTYTSYGFGDFLLGMPFSSQRLDPLVDRTRRDGELGLFIQDAFKVSSQLTLDLGLRWDRFGSPDFDDGLMFNWDPTTGNVLVPQEALGRISPLYPTNTIRVVAGRATQNPSGRNFAPRLGAAWRPLGGNFVVRGGYSIFAETLGVFARAQGVGPFQLSETFFNSVQSGQPLFAFPNPFPAGAGNIPSQSVSGFDPDTKNGRIHQFNLTLERQFKDIGFRLSYLGSRGTDLNYNIETNKPQPSLIPFNQSRRPFPQFVSAAYARNNAGFRYNGLTFQAQRKVGQLTFDAHWTWASNYLRTNNLENPYAPLFWSRDPFTFRHRVALITAWDLPFGRSKSLLANAPPVVQHVAGGWQLYWIAYMETGQFFSPSFSGADPSNTNTNGGLPDRIRNGNLPVGERQISRWFDTTAFAVPPAGRFGNSGNNVLEGPGRHTHDVTLGKRFTIKENVRFTFMAAAMNLMNRANFNNPSANISAPGSLGVISSTKAYAAARQIMLRGRLDF
jgi:hypothetical protein